MFPIPETNTSPHVRIAYFRDDLSTGVRVDALEFPGTGERDEEQRTAALMLG